MPRQKDYEHPTNKHNERNYRLPSPGRDSRDSQRQRDDPRAYHVRPQPPPPPLRSQYREAPRRPESHAYHEERLTMGGYPKCHDKPEQQEMMAYDIKRALGSDSRSARDHSHAAELRLEDIPKKDWRKMGEALLKPQFEQWRTQPEPNVLVVEQRRGLEDEHTHMSTLSPLVIGWKKTLAEQSDCKVIVFFAGQARRLVMTTTALAVSMMQTLCHDLVCTLRDDLNIARYTDRRLEPVRSYDFDYLCDLFSTLVRASARRGIRYIICLIDGAQHFDAVKAGTEILLRALNSMLDCQQGAKVAVKILLTCPLPARCRDMQGAAVITVKN